MRQVTISVAKSAALRLMLNLFMTFLFWQKPSGRQSVCGGCIAVRLSVPLCSIPNHWRCYCGN